MNAQPEYNHVAPSATNRYETQLALPFELPVAVRARRQDGSWIGVVVIDRAERWTSPYTATRERALHLAREFRATLRGQA